MRTRLELAEMCHTGILHRRVIDHLPLRISVKDASLAYVSCNEAYARDLNIKPDEILGKRDDDYFTEELAIKYRMEEDEILGSGVTKETEEIHRVPGGELTFRVTKTAIKNDAGVVIGLQIVLQDITQDRRRAESLESSRRNLEDRLAQGEEEMSALKAHLDRVTVQRNRMGAQIEDMQKKTARQEKQMAIRSARIEKLKNDLKQERRERQIAVTVLRRSFSKIHRVIHSSRHSTVLPRQKNT